MTRPFLFALWTVTLLFTAVALAADGTDYTGFWKWNCSDPFGLQIKPYKDGLYSVHFCGPGGGCNEPPDPRTVTGIDGDPRYEVVSPTEIHEKEGDTVYGVLHKCTTNTNPHLEYSAADIAEGRSNQAIVLFFHAVYLAAAIVTYRLLRRRLRAATELRLRVLRSAVLALLFAPGIAWAWPFASPTFALLAFVFVFLPALFASPATAIGPFVFAVGPMLVFSALAFFVSTLLALIRAPKTRA